MRKFRLLAGQHEQPDRTKPLKDAEGRPTGRFERNLFKAGDVVESDKDLVAMFGAEHFQALDGRADADAAHIARLEKELAAMKSRQGGQTPAEPPTAAPGVPVSDFTSSGDHSQTQQTAVTHEKPAAPARDLDAMSLSELKELAAEEEIDLGRARTKEDVIRIIRAAGS